MTFIHEARRALGLLALGLLTTSLLMLTPEDARIGSFVAANLVIAAGYLFVVVNVAPYFKVDANSKVGAIVFFAACAATHIDQAVHAGIYGQVTRHDFADWHMLAIHVPQAISIWLFVLGLRKSAIVPRERRAGTD